MRGSGLGLGDVVHELLDGLIGQTPVQSLPKSVVHQVSNGGGDAAGSAVRVEFDP